mmetsp:Transcript_8343/g.20600  ORF Transcript_8343/g.20600 Transcript_8343/m.20600 type:complete len:774 (+) Transcript_8343:278-2599(+)
MSAAFLVDRGTPKRMSSSGAFITQEQEEEGLKFSMENAAEDIVNTLFCTYEPPTSKKMQYTAAKAVRKHPEKYAERPHVPKSILKFKIPTPKSKRKQQEQQLQVAEQEAIAPAPEGRDDDATQENLAVIVDPGGKKSVTWRDQQREREDRTDIENKVVDLASKYCGGAFNQGEDIADVLSSPNGRAAQTFFAGPETPGSIANMASSLFGGKSAATDVSGASTTDTSLQTQMKIVYDDLGNPIREDDVQDDDAQSSYFPSTPKDASSVATKPATPGMIASPVNLKRHGHQNLFCSNIPFMDTVKAGIGIAGVMAASAASKANCTGSARKSAKQDQISKDLKKAQEALGVYEPESYDQPADPSGSSKLKRQSTPRHEKRPETPHDLSVEEDILDALINNEDDFNDEQRDASSLPTPRGRQDNAYSSQRSYANSDITMGNTTVKHFGGAGTASLFDELLREDGIKSPTASFSSMVEELKHVQKERSLSGRSQESGTFSFRKKNNNNDPAGVSVSSIKSSYEKYCKSPKKPVVTSSYKSFIKKSPINTGVASLTNGSAALPATPNQNRTSQSNDIELFETRSGAVASLAKQFESPRSTYRQAAMRKSVDPNESRFFDGKVDLLPPTPRRKFPGTPTYGGNNQWLANNAPTPNNRSNDVDVMSPQSVNTHNTDAEVREAPSTILDVIPTRNRPRFGGRRPRSLVTGPETVKDESKPVVDKNNESTEEDKAANNNGTGKKSKDGKTSFAEKFKKSMGKALNPVKNVTRKVEASRIPNEC